MNGGILKECQKINNYCEVIFYDKITENFHM